MFIIGAPQDSADGGADVVWHDRLNVTHRDHDEWLVTMSQRGRWGGRGISITVPTRELHGFLTPLRPIAGLLVELRYRGGE